MTKKDTEKKDVVTTDEEAINATEAKADATESNEKKTPDSNGTFKRVGALVVFVGVAAFILGSIWTNNAKEISSVFDASEDASLVADASEQATINTHSASTFTTEKNTVDATAPAFSSNNFANQNQQAFAQMRKQQYETVANNLQKQREMMRAAFENADRQRQAMIENARKAQSYQATTFQQPEFKQDPMAEIMQAHHAEMRKLMEERRQKFITEMNQARTTRS